jgi:hypothetical protein
MAADFMRGVLRGRALQRAEQQSQHAENGCDDVQQVFHAFDGWTRGAGLRLHARYISETVINERCVTR